MKTTIQILQEMHEASRKGFNQTDEEKEVCFDFRIFFNPFV